MKTYYLGVLIVGALVLSACSMSAGGSPTPTQQALDPNALLTAVAETMQAQNSVQPTAGAGIYQPVDNSVCSAVQQSLQPLYPSAQFAVSIEPFTDMSGATGTACVVGGFGTGNDFVGDVGAIAGTIGATLPGYIRDAMYAADGATGTIAGYRNGNSLAVVSVEWEPSPTANCPADQPIASCNLQPGDKLYTVLVSMASTGPTALAAPTLTPIPQAAPSANPACADSARLASEDPQDGAVYKPNTGFRKTWTLTNTGACTWDSSYKFLFVNGEQMAASGQVKPLVSNTVAPGGSLPIFIDMQAPAKVGEHGGSWSWVDGAGKTVPVSFAGGTSQVVTVKIKTQEAVVVAPTPAPKYKPADGAIVASYMDNLRAAFPGTGNWSAGVDSFVDMVTGVPGEASVIYGSGTGIEFNQGLEGISIGVVQTLPPGYTQDPAYAGSGPNGSLAGYRNGNTVVVIAIDVEPIPGACDNLTEQECFALPFDKQAFTVTIYMATK